MLNSLRAFIIFNFISFAYLSDVEIVTKAEWKGRESKVPLIKLNTPVPMVIIAHTASNECSNLDTCSKILLSLQNFHMDSNNFDDIGYNFLIGNDGKVYEGRGWDFVGAFARGYNAQSLGIAFIGLFENKLPSKAALDAAQSLLETGKSLGKIATNFKLYGHRQVSATMSPGNALYEEIKHWPNWSREID